jgi:shikimate kinase
VVYLEAPVALLAERVSSDRTNRPLVAASRNPQRVLGALLKQREVNYRQAHLCLSVVGQSPAELALRIEEAYRHGSGQPQG